MNVKAVLFVTLCSILIVTASAESDVCSVGEEACLLEDNSSFFASEHSSLYPANTTCVVYFYGDGCPKCAQIKPFIEDMASKYSDRIHVHWLELYHNKSNYDLYTEYTERVGIPQDKRGIPLVIIGDDYYMGLQGISDNLEAAIMSERPGESVCPFDSRLGCHADKYDPRQVNPERTVKVTTPLVILTGIVDGINPCAFAVLIFLLTYLTTIARSKKKMLTVGSTYIVTVYVVYFLAGVGLLGALQFTGFTSLFYKVAAAVAIIAGMVNLKDYFWYGKGISLAIPESKKGTLERWAVKMTAPAAVVLGFLVAMFELPCTGGVYLAILAMMSDSMTLSAGIPYLLLYNLMFVMPLIVIFIAVYFGFGAERLEAWRQSEKKKMRLALGLLLVGLGLYMLRSIYVI
ncbi:MAG: cytochrome c biogenesis protein CcdA [Candidatus Altiarchaeota archaeon]